MTQKIRIEQLQIPNLSEQQWQDLYTINTEWYLEEDPDDPTPSLETLKKELATIPERRDHIEYWLAYDDENNLVGELSLSYPKPENEDYEANKVMVWIDVYVRQMYRRQGYGTQLLAKAVERAKFYGAEFIQSGATQQDGFDFAKSVGAKRALVERISRMMMADTDWQMLENWVKAGEQKNPEVEIIRFEGLPPEADIEAYCQLITDLDNTVPLEDLIEDYTLTVDELHKQYKRENEAGHRRISIYAKDKDGSLMGMTSLFHHADMDTISYVGLTGTRKQYQGRGLGKWLKALMSFDLQDNFPKVEFVETGNAESNAPMLSINERMNFRPHKQWVGYKVPVSELNLRLDKTHL